MLYTPGQPDDTYSRDVERVLSSSRVEETSDGFAYFVSDPNEEMGLTMSTVFRTPEQSDLTLIVNGNVAKKDRLKIAAVAVAGEAYLEAERYWLARAIEDVVGWESDEEFVENVSAISLLLDALRIQISAIKKDPEIDPRVKARLELEAKSALGILATHRGVSDTGVEALGEFTKQGLWIPRANTDNVELAGALQTNRGLVTAGFVSMEEKSERHSCACCGAQIIKGTARMTLGLDVHDGYSDHHHYHIPCFIDSVIPRFRLDTMRERPINLGTR
ncbi:MAG: hypothetical protein Q7T41_04115 [Candidatus Saccharibacteria bacterium]|nr:hypothetical protein [Candidatus Saccharibacteria bacterium]